MHDVARATESATPSSGRYTLKGEIARGGMGAVFLAYDTLAARDVAYKRLFVRSERSAARLIALFEREYDTLAKLVHPVIVSAYEYGLDAEGPFYTMELLAGQGLMELAPLPYRELCRILRDVASALSLVHARRMIHRDLSPTNVRVNADGQTKLIDFGALVPFGPVADVVGTPAFMAPEALEPGRELDQRADLYALGALAYWGLTRRTAVNARSLADLPHAWLDPIIPPSRFAQIPEGLETLIMSLLAHDPRARPQSAAEVIERLTAIAELEPEPLATKVAASYIQNPTLCGRGAALSQLSAALKSVSSRGATFVVKSEPGGGKSALLQAFKVNAQVSGATVLSADVSAEGAAFGVARSLARTALALYPDLSGAEGPLHAQLAELLKPRPATDWSPVEASERQARTLALIQEILLEASALNPLVILVDDLERVDGESLALLATLASETRAHPLMLVATTSAAEHASDAYAKVKSSAKLLELAPLTAGQVGELVSTLFGGADKSQRLARWLFEQSGGNPARCMDLLRLLLQKEVICYAAGQFTLPHDIEPDLDLGDSGAVMLARLSDLSPRSREVALLLSLQELPAQLEHLAAALKISVPELMVALQELSSHAIASHSEGQAALVNVGLRDALAASLHEDQKRALHLALAHAMLDDPDLDGPSRMQAAVNLLSGGDEDAALRLLTDKSDDLIVGVAPVALLETLLEVLRRKGRRDVHALKVLVPLTRGGWFGDMSAQRRHLDRTLAALSEVCGLTLTKKLTPFLGAKLGLFVALMVAAVRLSFTPKSLRYGSLPENITALLNIVATATAAFAITWEHDSALKTLRVLEPLRALGKDSAPYLCMEFCITSVELARGRFAAARTGYEALRERLRRPVRGMPDRVREQFALGVLHGLLQAAVADAYPEVLKLADELERKDQFYAPHAQTVLMGYYGYRADMEACKLHRRKGELLALRGGISWTAVNLMTLRSSYIAMDLGDPVALARVISDFERIAAVTPRAVLYRDAARAYLELLRGRAQSAVEIYEAMFAAPHGSAMAVRFYDRAAYAKALSAVGRHADAKRVCEELLLELGPDEVLYNRKLAIQQLALAEAALGEVASAEARLDTLIASLEPYKNPLWSGGAHRDRAKVALFVGDHEAAEKHVAAMVACFEATGNASLIQQAEQLRKAAASGGTRSLDDAAVAFETAQSRLIHDSMDGMDTEMETEAADEVG